jgi:hypothetical protein
MEGDPVTKQQTAWAATIVLALSASLMAQESATIVKRDGSRVSGRFEAWNRNTNTLYVRVNLGDQRIIPFGEAAVIDAQGNGENLPETELGPARGGDHVLVLRTGDVIRGRLTNIEGGEGSGEEDTPRMVTFKPNDAGERRVRFSEVRRIYLGNYPVAPTAAAGTPLPEEAVPADAIRVAANAGWVDTGVNVRRTDRVAFTTTGQVQISGDAEDRAISAGSLKGTKAPAGAPAPGLLAGALIARVGNGAPFPIGDQTQPLPMPGDGRLFLTVNDDHFTDNQGAFSVTLRVTRRR